MVVVLLVRPRRSCLSYVDDLWKSTRGLGLLCTTETEKNEVRESVPKQNSIFCKVQFPGVCTFSFNTFYVAGEPKLVVVYADIPNSPHNTYDTTYGYRFTTYTRHPPTLAHLCALIYVHIWVYVWYSYAIASIRELLLLCAKFFGIIFRARIFFAFFFWFLHFGRRFENTQCLYYYCRRIRDLFAYVSIRYIVVTTFSNWDKGLMKDGRIYRVPDITKTCPFWLAMITARLGSIRNGKYLFMYEW